MANELLAALIGVAGTLGGVWYGARLSRQASRDLLSNQAKAEFAGAFAETLLKLTGPVVEERTGRAMHILKEDYPRHLVAYLRLRSVLPKQQQQSVDRAWQDYIREDSSDIPEEREFYRFCYVLDPQSDEHQFMLAAKHVNALLAKIAV